MAVTEKCLGLTTGFITTRTNPAADLLLPVADWARLDAVTALIAFWDTRLPTTDETFLVTSVVFLADGFFLFMGE